MLLLCCSRGFCVNGAGWANYGWKCDHTQAQWSNSYRSGSAAGTAAQQKKSHGTANFKSDSSKNPEDMENYSGSGIDAKGNPLLVSNYWSLIKYGNPHTTKWSGLTTRPDPEEKSHFYEGE